jgi:hypothetical protein
MTEIKEWWGVVIGIVALIAWALRVESNTKANAAEIRRLWRQREEDQQSHRESRGTTLALLDELRRDIKTLLSRRDG